MEPHSAQQKLIIVNGENCVRDYLATVCRRLDFDVATVSSAHKFRSKLSSFCPEIVILDVDLPEPDTMAIFKATGDNCSDAKMILISGNDHRTLSKAKMVGELLGLNVKGALRKPVLIDALRTLLNKAAPIASPAQIQQLRDALKNDDIKPAYQAKAVRRADGSWALSEAEVFARWQSPERETVSPSQFIQVAEEAGLLVSVTWSLLKQVVLQLRDWDDRGIAITVSINLPPSLLMDSDFPAALEELMKRHMLENSRLTLELAETSAMQSPGLATEVLDKLHSRGFGLSIDNFGAGYSSIEQLYQLPFTELKIDRYLVRELGFRTGSSRIVNAIIMLGRELGMSICAEGIESRKVLGYLLDAGCDKLQGYFIGRPGSARNLETRIQQFEKSGFTPEGIRVDETRRNEVLPVHCLS